MTHPRHESLSSSDVDPSSPNGHTTSCPTVDTITSATSINLTRVLRHRANKSISSLPPGVGTEDQDQLLPDKEDIESSTSSGPVLGVTSPLTSSFCDTDHDPSKVPFTMHLLSYTDLPEWMKDNDYIKKSYRPQLKSTVSCIKSIFRIHTETGNIWTHLIGVCIFTLTAIYCYYCYNYDFTIWDKLVFGIYFASAIACLLFSSIYHIFFCHSPELSNICRRFDYCGISILITGSFVSWAYYAFYTDTTPKYIYLSVVSAAGISISIISLYEKFGSAEYRTIRAFTYAIFGLSAALPIIHFFFFSDQYVPISMFSMVSFGAYYILGAVVYALRIPEKFFPGRFDILFHSHQIFHVLIVVAAFVHFGNIKEIALIRIDERSG